MKLSDFLVYFSLKMSFIVISESIRRLSSDCIQHSCGTGQMYHDIIRRRKAATVGYFAVETVVVKTEIVKN
jgi:hypothetical protein